MACKKVQNWQWLFLVESFFLFLTVDPDLNSEYGSGSKFWIRIRIQQFAEYGSNLDPDLQHWLE